MSEEEKKAIEDIKLFEYKYVLRNNDDKKIEILLNLLEKQQKEIEELKENNKIYKELKEELKPFVKDNYISKDKLKALKEEVDKNRQNEIVDYYKLYDGIESLLEEK